MSNRAAQLAPQKKRIPPLENGDRLSSDEFVRRYSAMPPHVKAELIEGVVYIASPVSAFHGNPLVDIIGWLYTYRVATPGIDSATNSTIRLDAKNVPQPDAVLYSLVTHGGPIVISDEGYITGAPELAVEISTSSVSRDLGPKMTGYARNGIREYIVWRTEEDEIDWFVLRDGSYVSLNADNSGIIRSEVFPGLWMDRIAMIERDSRRVDETLKQGLQSPEHAQFVAELAARRTS